LTDPSWGGEPTPTSRTTRGVRLQWHRRFVAGAVALVLIAVGAGVWIAIGEGEEGRSGPDRSAAPGREAVAPLLAFSVSGGGGPLLAAVGAGASPAALAFPPELTVMVPGQGETGPDGMKDLPPEAMRVTVSNTIGAWAEHYAVVSLERLGSMVDRGGGLTIDLPDAVTIGGEVMGPGETALTGDQVVGYLSEPGDALGVRWLIALSAFLRDPSGSTTADLQASDDASAAIDLLHGAAGADVSFVPTKVVGGTTTVVEQPDLDETTADVFGVPTPVPVLVQNGSGRPGVGRQVAARLVPHGFRVVLSENAASFDHRKTLIVATGQAHLADAHRARRALGVGSVRVTQVPSGLADVTIVVGKDFAG
jgi:hypothetical protein